MATFLKTINTTVVQNCTINIYLNHPTMQNRLSIFQTTKKALDVSKTVHIFVDLEKEGAKVTFGES